MIFIAGVHGVGKTFLCNRIKREIEISIYSASELLKEDKEINYIRYEKTDDFMENQKRLLEIVKKKNGVSEYILEGHFCLMNDRGRIENIPVSMFRQFEMKGILLLIGNPKKIQYRIRTRKTESEDIEIRKIIELQEHEIAYGSMVSKILDVPISKINVDVDKRTFEFEYLKNINLIKEMVAEAKTANNHIPHWK